MIVKKYQDMLGMKSVIREISVYATARGKEIGYENVFDYSLGNPSVPVPEKFNTVIKELLDTREPVALHGYSPSHGLPEVREKIAASLSKRFGLPYKMEDIFMTSGAAGSIAHAARAVAGPGDEIITFAPYFPEYGPYISETGAALKVVPADTGSFQINFEAFEAMINERTAAVLINTPNNPSGIVYSTGTSKRLAEILKDNCKTIHIENDSELEIYKDLIDNAKDIAITAGASTPQSVIEKVVNEIKGGI